MAARMEKTRHAGIDKRGGRYVFSYCLSVALLVIEHEPQNAERAALRWLGRWALESKHASLAGLVEATVALSALAQEPEKWEAVLRRLAGRR